MCYHIYYMYAVLCVKNYNPRAALSNSTTASSRAAATAAGETVRPTTDFAILAALASFVYRFYL